MRKVKRSPILTVSTWGMNDYYENYDDDEDDDRHYDDVASFTSLALLSRILILGAGASGADVILIMSGSLCIIIIIRMIGPFGL